VSIGQLPGVGDKRPPRPGRAQPDSDVLTSGPAATTTTLSGTVVKLALLSIVAALAVWAMFPLISSHSWVWLAVLIAATLLIFYVYLSPRRIAAKYLVPGTIFLLVFQVVPIIYTASTAFSNFGDGHRGSKQDAITSIQTASVKQVPGSAEYGLSVATKGDPASAKLVFLLLDPSGRAFLGDRDGLHPLGAGDVTVSGSRITAAPGYTLLNLGQANTRGNDILAIVVPTTDGAIRASGITRAYDGQASQKYDSGCDCITDTSANHVWTADNKAGAFIDSTGARLPQGWKVNVGFKNFAAVLTNSNISSHFLSTLAWNLAFAFLSVFLTFVLGLGCAMALDSERVRGKSWYRVLLVLPYAMPSFAMLLVWADMFNQDFGLINKLFGVDVDWLGGVWSARFSVIFIQLWLGYPYMFLVSTGALQAIPKELQEAARVDGAGVWMRFRQVTLPLLLVALMPLLISSFAFNFNNFNAVKLTTDGGPFPASDSSVGATDLLITYTYRLAFGGSGAQFGFAAAISIYIFAIVALISIVSFRRTRKLEEVYT
jgi:arabinogalactan oligomer/maltooligosaccharide transport system permease protein